MGFTEDAIITSCKTGRLFSSSPFVDFSLLFFFFCQYVCDISSVILCNIRTNNVNCAFIGHIRTWDRPKDGVSESDF